MKIKDYFELVKNFGSVRDVKDLERLVAEGKIEKNQAKKFKPALLARQQMRLHLEESALW